NREIAAVARQAARKIEGRVNDGLAAVDQLSLGIDVAQLSLDPVDGPICLHAAAVACGPIPAATAVLRRQLRDEIASEKTRGSSNGNVHDRAPSGCETRPHTIRANPVPIRVVG